MLIFSNSFARCECRKFCLTKDIANLSNIYLKYIELIISLLRQSKQSLGFLKQQEEILLSHQKVHYFFLLKHVFFFITQQISTCVETCSQE